MVLSLVALTLHSSAAYQTDARGVKEGVFLLGYPSQGMAAPAQTTVSLESTALYSMCASLVLQHWVFSYKGSVQDLCLSRKKAKGSTGSQVQQSPRITWLLKCSLTSNSACWWIFSTVTGVCKIGGAVYTVRPLVFGAK